MSFRFYFYFYFFCPAIFVLSYYFFVPAFTGGDSEYYTFFYQTLIEKNVGWGEIINVSKSTIGTLEPGYPLLAKLFVLLGLSKIFFTSFINVMFFISLGVLCLRRNINIWILLPVVLSSYYFLILLSELDRLKLSVSFLILALSYIDRVKFFVFLMCLALFVHVQLAIFFFPFFFMFIKGHFSRFFNSGLIDKNMFYLVFIVFLIIPFFYLFLLSHVVEKFQIYHSGFYFIDFLRSIAFSLLVFLCLNQHKYTYVFFTFFLCLSVVFLSSDRLNVMIYFMALYFLLLDINKRSVFFLTLMFLYWGWKGLRLLPMAIANGSWVGLV